MTTMFPIATFENFDEEAYLLANKDVSDAVQDGTFQSGLQHFRGCGIHEGRRIDTYGSPKFKQLKAAKLERIRPHLRNDLPCNESEEGFNFLSAELASEFSIIDTPLVSSNGYDNDFMSVIRSNEFVLDCGAGFRPDYIDNVVNFEIVNYPSTDVVGVGEVLPFRDSTFDAVISNAVLEHVKNPWMCASELLRVLKPGGEIICCVPFLQPLHGYPHHYYNMSGQGLKNLFEDHVDVIDHYVPAPTAPIWALTWFLNSWSAGLKGTTKDEFLQMKVADLVHSPEQYLQNKFVTELSVAKNFELASATVLRARKK